MYTYFSPHAVALQWKHSNEGCKVKLNARCVRCHWLWFGKTLTLTKETLCHWCNFLFLEDDIFASLCSSEVKLKCVLIVLQTRMVVCVGAATCWTSAWPCTVSSSPPATCWTNSSLYILQSYNRHHNTASWFKPGIGWFWAPTWDQIDGSAVCCFPVVVNSNGQSSWYLAYNAACSCQCKMW